MADGETVGRALAIGLVGLAIIVVAAAVVPKVPGVLVAVVVGIAAVVAFDLAPRACRWWASCPRGSRPSPCPTWSSPTSALLVAGALGITLVSLTDTISTASSFAARTGEEVDADQEMIGIGAANLAAGLFQGFPVSTSGSRTAVAEQAGAKTQLPAWSARSRSP